jgi:uncharacterized protein YsxB (DUF464 family)
MTELTFYKDDLGNVRGFQSKGHSGYAEAGSDIVCSAISALVINTVNSIEAFTGTGIDVEADEEEGIIKVSFSDTPDHDADLLLKSLILGIQSIKDDEETEQFVNLIFKEV